MLIIRQQQIDQLAQNLIKNNAGNLFVQPGELSQPAKIVGNGLLCFRDEQVKHFEQMCLRNFENEMVDHVKEYTPIHSETIGEQGVLDIVKTGINRAGNYGLSNRGPVRFYIEMMFMLGSDFDTDPQYPWASRLLNDSAIDDQMKRADQLYDSAMDYIKAVYGPQNRYAKEALMRVVSKRFDDLPVSEETLVNELREIYPQKCNYIGDDALDALMVLGKDHAKKHDDPNEINTALFVGMMFIFGHGCFIDPQYQWISGKLSNTFLSSPDDKLKRLYSKTMSYLNQALIRMELR